MMKRQANKQGMTLVEMLLVVAIIATLATFLVFAMSLAIRSRQNAECARKLRSAVEAFELYEAETGAWPEDRTPGGVPPEMVDYYFPYFKIDSWWTSPTELGGYFDWDNGYNFNLSVSISAPTASSAQMIEFDKLIDDGNLDAGNFRKVGSQYHYIIEQ